MSVVFSVKTIQEDWFVSAKFNELPVRNLSVSVHFRTYDMRIVIGILKIVFF